MQIIQANKLNNKLGVINNLPFAIDSVSFINNGFVLYLTDYNGEKRYVSYADMGQFRRDFTIVDSIKDIKGYKELEGFIEG